VWQASARCAAATPCSDVQLWRSSGCTFAPILCREEFAHHSTPRGAGDTCRPLATVKFRTI